MQNLCVCGHSISAHRLPEREGEPLKCAENCLCEKFSAKDGRITLVYLPNLPLVVQVAEAQPGVVFINDCAFAIEAFQFLGNPRPVLCAMEKDANNVTIIRQYEPLHRNLLEYAKTEENFFGSTLENEILQEAKKLKAVPPIEEYLEEFQGEK